MTISVQLTNQGQALLQASTRPITLSQFKLGSAVNYVPEPTDTNIHGTLVFSGTPSAPIAATANVVKYGVVLDYPVGPFYFGELGLYTESGVLFALAAWSELIQKISSTTQPPGMSMRIDIYVAIVGQNYSMWLEAAESNNEFRMAILSSPDLLPPSQNAVPNAYVISGYSGAQSTFLAYTDQLGQWQFDTYQYSTKQSTSIVSADGQSVTILASELATDMIPAYIGQVILEFSTGALVSTCRYVTSVVESGLYATLNFDNPVMILPVAGDLVSIFVRQEASSQFLVPPATHQTLGLVQLGNSIIVTSGTHPGIIDVDYTQIPYPVTSVNGLTGTVTLSASNITGFAAVAYSGSYNDLVNLPAPYTLPVASLSTLGGVKAPSSGNLTIDSQGVIDLGFSSFVTSFNGRSGTVTLQASDINGAGGALINSPTFTGVPAAPTATAGTNTTQVATTAFVASAISAAALQPATTTTLGGVIVKTGLTVDGSGNLSLAAPSGPSIGGVKAGTGVTIAVDGTISTSSNVTSVDGQTGAVVIQAQDNNNATGSSWVVDSGATTGILKFRTIVAGTNITLGTDVNGNITVTAATAGVSSFNTRTGAVTLQASDVTGVGGALVGSTNTWTGANNFTGGSITVPTITSGDSTTNAASTAFVAAAKYYDVPGGAAGVLTSSQLILKHVAVRTISFAANFSGSAGAAGTAATASTTFNVAKNGSTVGTISWAASAATCTFSTSGGTSVSLAAGDVLTVTANSTADTTLADVSFTFLGLAT